MKIIQIEATPAGLAALGDNGKIFIGIFEMDPKDKDSLEFKNYKRLWVWKEIPFIPGTERIQLRCVNHIWGKKKVCSQCGLNFNEASNIL